jgi:hypothetical protein
MPVILTKPEEIETWMIAPPEEALKLQLPLPDGLLEIVAQGVKKDEAQGRLKCRHGLYIVRHTTHGLPHNHFASSTKPCSRLSVALLAAVGSPYASYPSD